MNGYDLLFVVEASSQASLLAKSSDKNTSNSNGFYYNNDKIIIYPIYNNATNPLIHRPNMSMA